MRRRAGAHGDRQSLLVLASLEGAIDEVHAAILLPQRPDDAVIALLDWLEIGVLWLEGERLRTATAWLEPVAQFAEA